MTLTTCMIRVACCVLHLSPCVCLTVKLSQVYCFPVNYFMAVLKCPSLQSRALDQLCMRKWRNTTLSWRFWQASSIWVCVACLFAFSSHCTGWQFCLTCCEMLKVKLVCLLSQPSKESTEASCWLLWKDTVSMAIPVLPVLFQKCWRRLCWVIAVCVSAWLAHLGVNFPYLSYPSRQVFRSLIWYRHGSGKDNCRILLRSSLLFLLLP